MYRAWIDESIRVTSGIYVLGAFVSRVDDAEQIADRLRGWRGPGRRMHWRDERRLVRQRFLEELAGIAGFGVAVVGNGLNPSKQERARRQCLQALLVSLEVIPVTSHVLERRTPSLDLHDLSFVEALRGQRWLNSRAIIEFGDPMSDPLLWVSDAICADVAASHADRSPLRLPFEVKVIRISLRM